MCCRWKQQGGWGLLACESWAVHSSIELRPSRVKLSHVSEFFLPSFLNLRNLFLSRVITQLL